MPEQVSGGAKLAFCRSHFPPPHILVETDKRLTAYQDFLTLWKDADPDIPILKEAKTEYDKLQ